MTKLFIIGNGFDLWHGLPTSFVFGARNFPVGEEHRLSYSGEASGRGTIAGR